MEENIISKKQFDLLFNNNNCVVFYLEKTDDDFRFLYTNKELKNIFTAPIEGKCISEILPKSRFNKFMLQLNKAIQSETEIEFKDFFFDELKEYKITLFPTFTEGKVYILSILKEIEKKKEYEDNLSLMSNVFSNTFLSVLLLSKDGKIVNANEQLLNKFHLKLDDVKGKDLFQLPLLQENNLVQLQQSFKKAINGISLTLEKLTFIDDKGENRIFITTLSPLMKNNSVQSVLLFMEEITHQHLQEIELKSTSHYLHNYKQALNSAAEVSITDINGYIIDVNDRFVEQSGYLREELIGQKHSLLNSRYHSNEFFKNMWETITNGKVWRGEIRNITKYGTYFWNDCTIIPLPDEEGNIKQFLSININITEKKNMIKELRHIEHIFKMITENTNDLIAVMNKDGIISYVSSAYERRLGYKNKELIGQFYTKLLSKESKQIWNDELSILEHAREHKIELVHRAKNGLEFWTECNYSVVKDYVNNKGAQIIMIAREITERKEIENRLLYLAYHDALTQLPNRRYISNEFPSIIEKAKRLNESVAVLYIDGDNFKKVNDEYGHNIGDEFIYQFGKALKRSIRSHDIVARLGGDEFIVILTGLAINEESREMQLERIVNRIKGNLQTGWMIDDHLFTPTASIGVAFYPDHGDTLIELLENSDRALYQIKFSSKDDYKIYDDK